MGNLKTYLRELIRNLRNMDEAQRDQELKHFESILDEAMKNFENNHFKTVEKLQRENARLRTLLNVAAEHIEELHERLE